jgi:cell division protein FtsB
MAHSTTPIKALQSHRFNLLFIVLLSVTLGASSIFAWEEIRYQSRVNDLSRQLQSAEASIDELHTQNEATQENVDLLNQQTVSLETDAKILAACIRDVSPFASELSRGTGQDFLNIGKGISISSSASYLRQSWNAGTCQSAQAILDRYP